jgi:hypothetical protein
VQARSTERVNGEREHHGEEDHDQGGMDEPVCRADLDNGFERLHAASRRRDRMLRNGDDRQQGAGGEEEAGDAGNQAAG